MGFVGGHLRSLLESQGHQVFGFDLKRGQDLRSYEGVRDSIDACRPDRIFHLAALAYVPESFLDPKRAIETNVIGSLNVLDAVRNIGLKTKIHLCGSSEEYGDVEGEDIRTTEKSLPNPKSPYAIGKLGMDHLGRLYSEAYNMDVVVTRTFNHTGPGRGEMYAESAWAKQIAEIERGDRRVLRHGDLAPIRNYTDVRDIVKAYTLAIDLPSGVYNICSDQNVSMGDVLSTLRGLAKCEVPTDVDKNLMRPADFSFKAPDSSKFKRITGWEPIITLQQTLEDILNDWRERLS
jgi:nucleoside-diphosphate-sugar epimerase